jgi:hypothetical protein
MPPTYPGGESEWRDMPWMAEERGGLGEVERKGGRAPAILGSRYGGPLSRAGLAEGLLTALRGGAAECELTALHPDRSPAVYVFFASPAWRRRSDRPFSTQ